MVDGSAGRAGDELCESGGGRDLVGVRSGSRTETGPQVMVALSNAAIGALRTAGVANIAANRHHAPTAPPAGTARHHLIPGRGWVWRAEIFPLILISPVVP
ncbi:hypothetical protein F4558_001225 [Micromonospora profundi]|nr:hypothetical protein [Micromonospora profundi]